MAKTADRRTPPFYRVATIFALSLAAIGGAGCKKKSVAVGGAPAKALAISPAVAAYVTNNGSDTLSVFDRDGTNVETVTVDIDADAHEAPHHLAVDIRTKRVFVALAFPAGPTKKKDPHAGHGNGEDLGKLATFDLDTFALVRTRDVQENPGDVILTHVRDRVLVTHFDMKRAMNVAARGGASPATMFADLTILSAANSERIVSRPLCVAPHGVVTTKDDKTAFVACYGSDELAVVDIGTPELAVARVPLGAMPGVPGVPRYGPYSATLTPDEARVVVADLEGQDLRVFDRSEKRFLERTVPLAAKAFMPAFVDGRTLIVPLQSPDGIARVDIDQGRVLSRATYARDECILPHVVRVAKDGRAYLVCEGDHRDHGSVLEIDPVSLAAKRRWTVGVTPDGIAFGDD